MANVIFTENSYDTALSQSFSARNRVNSSGQAREKMITNIILDPVRLIFPEDEILKTPIDFDKTEEKAE